MASDWPSTMVRAVVGPQGGGRIMGMPGASGDFTKRYGRTGWERTLFPRNLVAATALQ